MKKVLILLSNGFEVYEAASFIDVLGWANEYGNERVEVTTAGLRPTITSTFGLDVVPNAGLEEIDVDQYDALAIPGGFESGGFYEDAFAEKFVDVVKGFHRSGKTIASICTGALCVGKSGILAGRRATTYHLSGGKRRKELSEMGVDVQDEFIVVDDNVITSSCPGTAIDVALLLLEKLTSPDNAREVRRLMGFVEDDA
jgi:4-methyl-5(b-hydroxyethyl)-thiazole monophosphate biosynthesis